MEQNKDTISNAYEWKNGTIDLTLPDKKSFSEELKESKCVLCDTQLILGSESLLKNIRDDVEGMFVTCGHCKREYFVHEPLKYSTSNATVDSVFGL